MQAIETNPNEFFHVQVLAVYDQIRLVGFWTI
jgi:hypothetical protein